jgi:hypothetical protein
MNRFKEHYEKVIRPDLLLGGFAARNVHALPRLDFVVASRGPLAQAKQIQLCWTELATGQKAGLAPSSRPKGRTKVRKANSDPSASRTGPSRATATLRRDKMYFFLERLVTLVWPMRAQRATSGRIATPSSSLPLETALFDVCEAHTESLVAGGSSTPKGSMELIVRCTNLARETRNGPANVALLSGFGVALAHDGRSLRDRPNRRSSLKGKAIGL